MLNIKNIKYIKTVKIYNMLIESYWIIRNILINRFRGDLSLFEEGKKWIENKTNIELLAIGIGHDVTRYYNQAVKITDVQDLGDVMINQLTDLFVEKNKTIH